MCPPSKRYLPRPAGSESPVHAATLAGVMRSARRASRKSRCSITPCRKRSRPGPRLLKLRYSCSDAPGTRSGFTGSALLATARPWRARTCAGPSPFTLQPVRPSHSPSLPSGQRVASVSSRQVPRSALAVLRPPEPWKYIVSGNPASGIAPSGSDTVIGTVSRRCSTSAPAPSRTKSPPVSKGASPAWNCGKEMVPRSSQ